MRHLIRSVVAGLATLAAALTLVVVGSAAPAHAAAHHPIVFVHGFWGDDWNWGVMADRFRADGWSDDELFVWDYDTSQANETTAQELSAFVDDVLSDTGATQIDFVTHSMGGLSSRHYIKFLNGGGKVDAWVSLGGPNHGTNAAYACFDASCRDMRYDSPFLATLNSGDETPGAVRYGTVWSHCDEVINPDTSTVLAGADNQELSGCVGHISLLASSEAYTTVRDFVS